jgi:hypothetical protein
MFPHGQEKVPPINAMECALWLLQGAARGASQKCFAEPAGQRVSSAKAAAMARLRKLLDRSGIDALPEEINEARIRYDSHTRYAEIVPARSAFNLRNIPIPPSPAPLYLSIRIDPRDHLSCFLAAAVLLQDGGQATLPIVLDVGNSMTTPAYRPEETTAALSPLFTGVIDIARDRVHAAYVPDVLALDVLIPRLNALQTLVLIPSRVGDGRHDLILPPCLLAAPRSLHTLALSTYERPTTCGTLHLPPSLASLVLIEVQPAVREALFAALSAQNIAPRALHLHSYALVPASWSRCIRVLGPALSSLTLRMDAWGRQDHAPQRGDLDAFLAAVHESCPGLRNLALHLSLSYSEDAALTFSPSLALPATLRNLRLSVILNSRRVSKGSCGGLLDLLAVAARHGGIEELAVDVFTTTMWAGEETTMALARAAAAVGPRRKLGLALTSRESLPGTRNDPPGRHAWVIPLLSLLPASIESLALGFHTTLSGPYFLPIVLRAALRTLPNLRTLDLDDDTNPCGEALLALLRELDGSFPLRRFPLHSDWLHRHAPAEAEVRRWAEEAREAASSRASWAQVRKGIERGQERRLAASLASGSATQTSPMERLPCRPLMTISDLLAYAPDPEVRADVFAAEQQLCFK